MTEDDIRALATRFFDAIETGDVDVVRNSYAEECRIWHNTDNLEQTPDENLVVLKGLVGRIANRVYDERRLNVFPGGFVQRHVLRGTRQDGEQLALPACLVCSVKDGKITRLDEYLDSAHVAQFRKFA